MKSVLAVTGIRSEYDLLRPILRAMEADGGYNVQLAVSGAHLSDFHGDTLSRIRDDGFVIADCIDSLYMTERKTQRVKGLAALTAGLAQTVERVAPDMLMVVGDREESMATALVGNYMDTLVAHIGGGDPVYGNADDPIRFAVSRLAHIHLTTAQVYADNLIQSGEDEFRTFFIGNPALDNARETEYLSIDETAARLGTDLNNGKYLMLLQHPLSSERDDCARQMATTLSAVSAFCEQHDYRAIGIYPNTDPGAGDILSGISRFSDDPNIAFFRTIERTTFVNLLRHTATLAGNSSMGILEAPFYRIPVVNIGNRQKGRLNAGNVRFVDHRQSSIIEELERACLDHGYREKISRVTNPYGDGFAAEKTLDALAEVNPGDPHWLTKTRFCASPIALDATA